MSRIGGLWKKSGLFADHELGRAGNGKPDFPLNVVTKGGPTLIPSDPRMRCERCRQKHIMLNSVPIRVEYHCCDRCLADLRASVNWDDRSKPLWSDFKDSPIGFYLVGMAFLVAMAFVFGIRLGQSLGGAP